MRPKVSVILPVFNQERYVKEAVNSIIRQSFRDFELIIVDDGSTDDSFKIISRIKDPRIKIIRNKKNIGLTKSLNKALKVAKGEFLARMDGDDIAYPDRLYLELEAFKKNKNLYLVGSQADLIDKNGGMLKTTNIPTSYRSIKKVAVRYNPFIHPTIMFRKKLLTKIGFYNQKFRYAQDYDLILRALTQFECQNLPKPLLGLRVTESAVSISKHRQQQLTALLIRLIAIFKYKYPLYNLIFLVKPLISALIPFSFKRRFYSI